MLTRLYVIALVGCATASETPPDAAKQGPTIDAPAHTGPSVDAPTATGSDTGGTGGTGGCAFTGVLATWDFSAAAGSQTSTPVASTASGVTATDVARSSGINSATGAGSINASNWTTGASADATKYYSFSLTPPAGCTMTISSVAIDAHSSTSGPVTVALGTSDDSYGSGWALSSTAASTVAPNVTSTGALEMRVFGWQAGSASGTLRLRTAITVTGSLQ